MSSEPPNELAHGSLPTANGLLNIYFLVLNMPKDQIPKVEDDILSISPIIPTSKGKKYKYKPLQELLIAINEIPMSKQKEVLNSTIEDWKGDLEQVDDILIIGIRI